MPASANCSPIHAELLSTMMPSSSSVPMAMTSQRISCSPHLAELGNPRAEACRPSFDKLRTAPRGATVSQSALLDGRERCCQQDFVLLLDCDVAAGRRPDATFHRFLAYFGALVEALVGPDVQPLVKTAHVGGQHARQRRELDARGQMLLPALSHAGDRPGF